MKIRFYIILILSILFLLFIKFFVPNYPAINSNASFLEVKGAIDKIVKSEIREISFANLDNSTRGGVPIENIRAIKVFANHLDKCGDKKECLIQEYNKYMDNWASDIIRKKTKVYYMIKHYGVVGEQINKSLVWMY